MFLRKTPQPNYCTSECGMAATSIVFSLPRSPGLAREAAEGSGVAGRKPDVG